MVKLEPFEVDHVSRRNKQLPSYNRFLTVVQWISTRGKTTVHNLASTNAVPVSIKDLEALPGNDSVVDLIEAMRSRPLEYGSSFTGLDALRSRIADLYDGAV